MGTEVLPEQKAGQAQIGTFERENMITPERTGRFPANLIHDGSDEVVGLFPQSKSEGGTNPCRRASFGNKQTGEPFYYGDNGYAARFFYCAKASKEERGMGNIHPTVKPIALMQYLIKLVCPPQGIVLDPFTGSGSTLLAAKKLGFDYIGIELNPEYVAMAERRIEGQCGGLF